jgi:hypothetical protein
MGQAGILFVTGLFLSIGCTSVKTVSLRQNEEVRREFKNLEIDFDAYAFFTAVSQGDPDAILAIKKEFVDAFNPKGWTPRDQGEMPGLITGLVSRAPIKWAYGMPVKDENGVVKGKLYSRFDRHKAFIHAKKGYFTVQTPDMVFVRPVRGVFSPTPWIPDD